MTAGNRSQGLQFLRAIREYELNMVLEELRRLDHGAGRVLEVGAGSGWQSQRLAGSGYSVEAIDIDHSVYEVARVWPVRHYDGCHIPFPDEEFDVVFSSNVLEHVVQLDVLIRDMWRVLRPGGIAVHVVPSGSWRMWTNIAWYPAKALRVIGRHLPSGAGLPSWIESDPGTKERRRKRALFPKRHGETGNALTEMFHFTRYQWSRRLAAPGWHLVQHVPNRLFYTGNGLLDGCLPMAARVWLSRLVGSSCHVFVLRKAERPPG